MREFSIPPAVEVSAEANLADPVWHNAESHPDEIAVQILHDGFHHDKVEEISYAALRDNVSAVAAGLIAHGVQPGERVAIMSRTRYEWMLLDYAIWSAGGVVVPIYPTSSVSQIEWMLSDSGAVACVVENHEQQRLLDQLAPALPALRHIWRIETTETKTVETGTAAADQTSGAIATLTAAGTTVDPIQVTNRRAALRASDLATIIYTSGTTGKSKGCRILHRTLLFGVCNGMTVCRLLLNPSASTLMCLPLAHVLAREIQCGALSTRTTLAYSPDTKQLLKDLAQFAPTMLLAIPRVMERLFNGAQQKALASGKSRIFNAAVNIAISYSTALDTGTAGLRLRLLRAVFDSLVYRKLRATLGGRCTSVLSGGAPLSIRLGHFFRGASVTVYEGYGLTETMAACTVNTPEHNKIGTAGRPLPGVTIRIADDGEVLVKGGLVFDGYWRDEAATAQALDDQGWLYTGDIGALDEAGFLRITGRKKELIVTSTGKNVAPAPLEDALRAHPLISQCMVVGDNKPFIGCLITLDIEMLTARRELDDAVRADNGAPLHSDTALHSDIALHCDAALHAQLQTAVDAVNAAVSHSEAIKGFRVLSEDFSVENGELTPSLKVKRTVIAQRYACEIAAIYD